MTSPVITPAEALRALADDETSGIGRTLDGDHVKVPVALGKLRAARAAIPLAEAQERCVEALERVINVVAYHVSHHGVPATPGLARVMANARAALSALAALQTPAKEP